MRFRLATLLLAVTVLCGCFALLQALSPWARIVAATLLVALGAHFAAAALGASLRGDGPALRTEGEPPQPPAAAP